MKRIATIIASTLMMAAAPNYAQAAPVSAPVTVSAALQSIVVQVKAGADKSAATIKDALKK